MLLLHDPRCADYGSDLRPEQPARVLKTAEHLRAAHPSWAWHAPAAAGEGDLRRAHRASLLKRLTVARDFDDDTPYFEGIDEHARRSVGGALAAMEHALETHEPTFSLMRPPGHHATATAAMGFCYLNAVAVAVLAARARGVARVAVWDFDAHHGNGTEAILQDVDGVLFASVHQFPGYPGTGTHDVGKNCRNFPVAPRTPRGEHLRVLEQSWQAVLAFRPELILVSAGFDAYARDPLTEMTLEREDFAELGCWLKHSPAPTAAVLEGGYSPDLPWLIDSFLTAWAD